MKPLPEHGACFVCGTQNPHSIGIRWHLKEDGSIYGTITLSDSQQGPPGHSHGGATAALLDEAMGAAVWNAGNHAVAVNLTVDYRMAVPLGVEVEVVGRMVKKEGSALHAQGELRLPGGEIAVVSSGIFIEAPQFFQ
ncbi:MAG: PaaI family thioesterase [Anaerolineae bacterium]|nr:PaaI family thioesterase [Anaerolineae bacterium]